MQTAVENCTSKNQVRLYAERKLEKKFAIELKVYLVLEKGLSFINENQN